MVILVGGHGGDDRRSGRGERYGPRWLSGTSTRAPGRWRTTPGRSASTAVLGLTGQPDPADPEWIAGASGSALRFDGTSSVRLPDSQRLTPQHLTVEAVARADRSPGTHRYLVSRGGTGASPRPTGSTAGRPAGSRSTSSTAPALCCPLLPGDATCGTASGTGSRASSTAPHCVSWSTAARSGSRWPPRCTSTTEARAPKGCSASTQATARSGSPATSTPCGSCAENPEPAPGAPQPPGLPAAAPGTTPPRRPAGRQDRPGLGHHTGDDTAGAKSPCTVRLSRRTIVAGRRTVVRARLTNAPGRAS